MAATAKGQGRAVADGGALAIAKMALDRKRLCGVRRGLAPYEYDGFRLDQNQGRERFVEYAELILNAFETGNMEGGATTNQPRREIRPRPAHSFKGRTYAAAVSPESCPIMAKLGVGLLVIPKTVGSGQAGFRSLPSSVATGAWCGTVTAAYVRRNGHG